jgi:hypothetical protein
MDYGGSPYGQSSCGQSTISPITQWWAVSLTKDMQRVPSVDLIWVQSIPLNWKKQTYGGTRRWLPENHRYRSAAMKDHFDGKIETHGKPVLVTVQDQIRCATKYQAWRDAGNRPGIPGDPSKVHGVKRLCILDCLSYWEVRNSTQPHLFAKQG